MGIEIEKKFLIEDSFVDSLTDGVLIEQGYIDTVGKTVVRVRIHGDKAFITIKGENVGAIRAEYEYEIPEIDAKEMISSLCGSKVVSKTRFLVKHGLHTWEIDKFHGENDGLIVAEIELSSENEDFELPLWAATEVTGDPKYYNSNLLKHPFANWNGK